MVESFYIFVAAIFVFVMIIMYSGIKIVPQSMEYTIETFGRYTGTLGPGLHLIVPVMQRIGERLSMREQVLDVMEQEVITSDNAMIKVDGVVFYQVLDAAKAAYEVDNLQNAILNLSMTNLRTVMGSMDLDELLSQRDRINAQLLGVIDNATSPWGIKVTRVDVKDITPPRDLVDSMARQMKAERDTRASILGSRLITSSRLLLVMSLEPSAPSKFSQWFDDSIVRQIQKVRDSFPSPEHINDSPQTAPSKRILGICDTYQKVLHGTLIPLDIGLDQIRNQCCLFDAWITRLEGLAPQQT